MACLLAVCRTADCEDGFDFEDRVGKCRDRTDPDADEPGTQVMIFYNRIPTKSDSYLKLYTNIHKNTKITKNV